MRSGLLGHELTAGGPELFVFPGEVAGRAEPPLTDPQRRVTLVYFSERGHR